MDGGPATRAQPADPFSASAGTQTCAPPRPHVVPTNGGRRSGATAEAPVEPAPPGRRRRLFRLPKQLPARWWVLPVASAVALGVVFRFATASHLWLDEALTVNIASRPLGDLFGALRHDGAPPLYYLILHVWIKVFGTGDVAVRALSGVLSVATLPVAYIAGRRVARVAAEFGHVEPHAQEKAGLAALLLFATSPYAIRYGSETRMYSLVVLLVLLYGLALLRALERPGWRRWLPLTALTSALSYTHYWTFLLLGTVAVCLALQARRRPTYRRACRGALGAMALAAVPFLPWLPTFAFQMLHTGTPWAPKVHAEVLLNTVFDWAGPASTGALLGLILIFAAFIGFSARPAGDGLHVELTGRVPGRYLMLVWLLPLALAYLAYVSGGSAYAERYTGISLPAFLLLAALGIGLLPRQRMIAWLLVVACISGLLGGFSLARQERTQAGQVAARIQQEARPGDVVAFCPDQLGPAVHRSLLHDGVTDVHEIAFADASGPALVDWVDYATRMEHASATDFAEQVDRLAGPDSSIYFVRADGYRTLEDTCSQISDQLTALGRDRTTEISRNQILEGIMLERFSTKR